MGRLTPRPPPKAEELRSQCSQKKVVVKKGNRSFDSDFSDLVLLTIINLNISTQLSECI